MSAVHFCAALLIFHEETSTAFSQESSHSNKNYVRILILSFLLAYVSNLYWDLVLGFGPSLGTSVKLDLVNYVKS